MFKIGDYIMFKKDLCKVKEIKNNKVNKRDYYILSPIIDSSLTIEIPVDDDNALIHGVISKESALELLKTIPNISPIVEQDRLIENEYKALLSTNKHEDLVKIIKTVLIRNKARTLDGKKLGDKDQIYFERAQQYLFNELAVALDISYDECKDKIIKLVEENDKN